MPAQFDANGSYSFTEGSPLTQRINIPQYDSSSSSSSISKSKKMLDAGDIEIIQPLSEFQAELPDITLRGIILGLSIGSVLSFTNMYFGLQTGWISMMSLQSSLVAFGLGKLLSSLSSLNDSNPSFHSLNVEEPGFNKSSGRIRKHYRWYDLTIPFGIKENVFIQTCSVATAAMPLAGGFVGVIPALKLLTKADRPEYSGSNPGIELSTIQLIVWGLGIAFFGAFFAIPLRQQVILKEKLKFPSGTATAQMIQLLHKPNDDDQNEIITSEEDVFESPIEEEFHPSASNSRVQKAYETKNNENTSTQWKAIAATFSLSSASTLFTNLYPSFGSWPIFDWIFPQASHWNWYFSPALSYMGQGIIMGLPTCLSMLCGAIVGWGVLSPLSFWMGWAPGDVNDSANGPRGWILWVSLAVMISESLVSLSLTTYKELYAQFQAWSEERSNDSPENEKVIPNWAIVAGLVTSTVICMLSIQYTFYEIPTYSIVLAIFLGCLLSVLAVRALGETDLNPVSGISKLSQVAFAVVLPGNIVGNIVAGGVAEAGAMQAGEMMQDLKTGHLVNASPTAQFYGQIIGSLVSVFVSVFAYQLYNTIYTIPGPEFQAPTAQVWLDMARLVNGQPLPAYAGIFSLAFAAIFALFPIAKHIYPNNYFTNILPSGIAFAIGIYNPPNFTLTRVLGALICEAYLNGWFGRSILYIKRKMHQYLSFCRSGSSASPDLVPCRDWNGQRFCSSTSNTYSSNDAATDFQKVLFTVIASGLVLGEGTMSIIILVTKVFF